jgi:hypothetical protein
MLLLNRGCQGIAVRPLIILVTNVMFAGHVVFGCCLHHVHCEAKTRAADDDCGHRHAATAHSHVIAFFGDHEHDHDACPAEGGAPSSPCDKVRCSFVKCELQRVDVSPADASWTSLTVTDVLLTRRDSSPAALALSAAFRPGDCPLHKLYCALLI